MERIGRDKGEEQEEEEAEAPEEKRDEWGDGEKKGEADDCCGMGRSSGF